MDDKQFGKIPPAKSYYILGKSARFVSLKCIPFIAKTKMRPFHLSVASFVSAVFSALFFTFNTSLTNKFALVFFLLFFIADHMDGDLARYRGEVSLAGEALDHVIGKLSLILIYGGIFCGLSRSYDPVFVWAIGFVLIGGFFGFQSLVTKRLLIVRKNNIMEDKFERKGQSTQHNSLLRILLKEVTAVYMVVFYLIIFGSLFDKLFMAMIYSVIYVWLYYTCQIFTSLKYFHHIDQQ